MSELRITCGTLMTFEQREGFSDLSQLEMSGGWPDLGETRHGSFGETAASFNSGLTL